MEACASSAANIPHTHRQYRIRTLSDMFSVVTEKNLDDFVADLRLTLQYGIKLHEAGLTLDDEYIWVDDGVRELRVTFKPYM